MEDRLRKEGERSVQGLVEHALRNHVEGLDELDDHAPFFVCNVDHVTQQYREWTSLMHSIEPFYAVKCNPDIIMIEHLAALGANFDCASQAEIELVLQQGIEPTRIIFAHPCKANSCLRYARDNGVSQMTFDNAAELRKIAAVFPAAELYLRIMADDETAVCRLGEKFGAGLEESKELLALAKTLGLDVVGISFHVGSGATDPKSFHAAIQDAYEIWQFASENGVQMHTLDIGGGFSQGTLEKMAPAIQESLESYFGNMPVRVIAEPGRYFAEGAFTLCCQVVAKRGRIASKGVENGRPGLLYLNDGVYGDFSIVVFEKAEPVPRVLKAGQQYFPERCDGAGRGRKTQYTVFGPTCDNMDCIRKTCMLPVCVDVGDWLYFEDMGAYSRACATAFNGFSNARQVIYVSGQYHNGTLGETYLPRI